MTRHSRTVVYKAQPESDIMLRLYHLVKSTGGHCSAVLGLTNQIAGRSPGPVKPWVRNPGSAPLGAVSLLLYWRYTTESVWF